MKTLFSHIASRKKMRDQGGFALVIAMGILTVLLLACLSMATITNQSLFKVRRIAKDAKAVSIAEAGVADMIVKLHSNYLYWQNNTNSAGFANGTYSVVTEKKANGNVLITSTGTFGFNTRTTVMELLGTSGNTNNQRFDLNGVILAGGNVSFESAAFKMYGNVHANQNVTEASGGKNGTIDGTVSAVGTIGDLDGTLVPGSPTRVLPTFNFDSYRSLALTGGVYFATNKSWSGATISSPNGIIYVNGNATIGGRSILNGCLVANGTVTVDNRFEQHNAVSNYPAIICKGTLDVDNQTTWNGLLYSGGNVEIRNRMTMNNGGVIAVGYVSVKNGVTMNKPSGYPPWDPLNPEENPDVIVGGWLK